jgi:hypothetical protein
MIEVSVCENDIVRSIKNTEYSPVRLALCRALKCDDDTLDIHKNEIKVWIYDEAYHFTYKFHTVEDEDNFNDFIDQWIIYINDESIETFEEQPFIFYLEEDYNHKLGSIQKIISNLDYDQFTDRPSSNKKNPKFRLTDDDE